MEREWALTVPGPLQGVREERRGGRGGEKQRGRTKASRGEQEKRGVFIAVARTVAAESIQMQHAEQEVAAGTTGGGDTPRSPLCFLLTWNLLLLSRPYSMTAQLNKITPPALLSTLTPRTTHAHPTSPPSTGFCAIWDCISSSSSSIYALCPSLKVAGR